MLLPGPEPKFVKKFVKRVETDFWCPLTCMETSNYEIYKKMCKYTN